MLSKIRRMLIVSVLVIMLIPTNIIISACADGNIASVTFVGDSITYGSGTDKTYHAYIDETGVFESVQAMGVSGSCISTQSDYGKRCSPLAERYSSVPGSDLIVVFMGTNDYGHETPLGKVTDATDVSFYGALNVVISGLKTMHRESRLVFVTPLHRFGFGTGKILGVPFTYDYIGNGLGHNLSDYVNAIKEVCKIYSVPVIDLYNQYPIDPSDSMDRAMYMPDGLHPDAEGHKIIADLILLNLGLIAERDSTVSPDGHIHSYISTTFEPTCITEGYKVHICACGSSYHSDRRSVSGHNYNGNKCSVCGLSDIPDCSCSCHKGGLSGFIWKILRFFYMLFGMNKNCICGKVHY